MKCFIIFVGLMCLTEGLAAQSKNLPQLCTNGAIWRECKRCQRTCQNYAFIRCSNECVDNIPGCYCPDDLVLDQATNQCVSAVNCKTCFGSGEEWKENGPCDGVCSGDILCAADPGPGCYCEADHVRNEFGLCIPQVECPPIISPLCPFGQEWLNCGHCEFVCGTGGPKCRPGCRTAGCHCIEDYARDENSNCIPRDECPAIE